MPTTKQKFDAGMRSIMVALPDALGSGVKFGLLALFVWYVWELAALLGVAGGIVIAIAVVALLVHLVVVFIQGANKADQMLTAPAAGNPCLPSVLAFVLLVAIPVVVVAGIDRYAAPESSKSLLNGTLLKGTVTVLHAIQD